MGRAVGEKEGVGAKVGGREGAGRTEPRAAVALAVGGAKAVGVTHGVAPQAVAQALSPRLITSRSTPQP